ncbi:MAG: patatin-like phospholipase family protein [Hyphomicrobiales bacterium]|nr:patatin-like phospholipase family protein [Hyphomicrobiales bacterium]
MTGSTIVDTETPSIEEGMGLCLSGGGYRAMLFHLGTIWRLYDAGLLNKITRISSVSGGSITSAQLAVAWKDLSFDLSKIEEEFVPRVVKPIRNLASTTIDRWSIAGGLFLPGSISSYVTDAYKKHLFGNKTLQDMPDEPRFIINATNLQSGVLCRFSKPYMRDYRVGMIENPTIELALAVTASSAFPPFLSPCIIDVEPTDFTPGTGTDLQRQPFTDQMHLSDGGVYDNLGLETVWKRCKTVFVSDGGGQMLAEEEPDSDWARQSKRVLDIIDNKVRSLRKRHLIASFTSNERDGAYWGIRTNIADFDLPETGPNAALDAPFDRAMELARIPTRLKRMPDSLQEKLTNWGYSICDASLRAHYDPQLTRGTFPYPDRGI